MDENPAFINGSPFKEGQATFASFVVRLFQKEKLFQIGVLSINLEISQLLNPLAWSNS